MKPQSNLDGLLKLFEDNTFLQILDVFMDSPKQGYNKAEVESKTGLTYSTVHKYWSKLEDLNLITPTQKVGSSQLYDLNTGSDLLLAIQNFEQDLKESGDLDSWNP